MSEAGESIANRDEPIPIIRVPTQYEDPSAPGSSSEAEVPRSKSPRRERLKREAGKLKGKLDEFATPEAAQQSLGDRFFAGLMAHMIPTEGLDAASTDDSDSARTEKKNRRSNKYVSRPNFSPVLMGSNFKRFNARIGVVFVMENRLIHLFTWRHPTATLSFLAVYSLLCLKPYLLPLIPLVGVLFGFMIPSFLARHPAPANDPRIEPSLRGPATAPPSRVKPAAVRSNDFYLNMRDLQNSMEDFSRLHDAANEYITPLTNFSDERRSSSLFVILVLISCTAFIGSHRVPWRALALIAGWTCTLICHPKAQSLLLSSSSISQIRAHTTNIHSLLSSWTASDILLTSPPEIRQVEIFELQKHSAPFSSASWEHWLWTPSPYDPLSPTRIAGAWPKGTQFFEEVTPPAGWEFKDKKWTLDLASREWVEQRLITGVEVETEGERWVYDLSREVVSELQEGGSPFGARKKGKAAPVPRSGWEEGTGSEENRGEWRRRRWVRLVERMAYIGDAKRGNN